MRTIHTKIRYFVCIILVISCSLLCVSVFWSLSLDYILLISAKILVPLITLSLYLFYFFDFKCSKTCGKGIKTRNVACYDSEDSPSPSAHGRCFINHKPAAEEICMEKPCYTSLSKLTLFVVYGRLKNSGTIFKTILGKPLTLRELCPTNS